MNPTFSYLTDVFFEAGAIRCIPELLERFKVGRPLVVTDPGLVERGLTSLPGLVGMPLYDGVRTNPSEDQVLSALKVYRDAGCDGLVALGGGSPIDLAKCVGILVNHSGPLASYALLNGGVARITGSVPPLIAVPTTAGSGSEVGRAALATLASGEKMGFLSPYLLPKAAVCDPELTLSMPPGLTAGTGMDAISHCVETYCSTRKNPIADAIALDGLERGCASLERAVQHGGDLEARTEMMLCSLEGGLAFQKSLGAVHSLSHPLGGLEKGLHHGTLNGLFLPAVLRFNADFCVEKFHEMARRLGVENGSTLADYFETLNRRLGLPRSLTEMGVTEEDLEPLAARAVADHCTPTNPRPLDEAACRAMYHSLL